MHRSVHRTRRARLRGDTAGHRGRPGGSARVAPADAFFLHVETPNSAQHVGGVVLLDLPSGGSLEPEAVAAVVREALPELPRFRQRLVWDSRWRRPRWVAVPEGRLDWSWHVPAHALTADGGEDGEGLAAFHAFVGQVAATPLPRDRPLWRLFVVPNIDERTAGIVLVVHHVIADGVGTVAQALRLLRPRLQPEALLDGVGRVPAPGPGRVLTGVLTGLGIGQLAADSPARGRLPEAVSSARGFTAVQVPLDRVRAVARWHQARVTDVLLSGVAGAVGRLLADPSRRPTAPLPRTLRVTVSLMLRAPDSIVEGNVTGAVLVDLPLGGEDEVRRLRRVVENTARLRTPSRALASRFVMTASGRLLPPPVHGAFARAVYGRRFFQAVVSNMPGPSRQLSLAGAPIRAAHPLLPPAPGTPLAVGALGWNGQFCVGITCDPEVFPDPARLGAELVAVIDRLAEPVPLPPGSATPAPA